MKSKITIMFTRIALLAYLLVGNALADSNVETTDKGINERGSQIINKCLVCHTVGKGDAHAAGPNLFGLIGRPVGKQEGYKFSRVLRKSDAVWTPELLDQFLAAPATVFRRNRMAFAGLKNESDREALLRLLATLKD